jgi:hypothetical protein
MKRSNGAITLAFCVILILAAAQVFATDEVTITGTLYPSALDDHANPREVVIVNEAGDFTVVDDAVGQQLLKLAGKDVQVHGVLKKDDQGKRTITVSKFIVMTD